MSKQYMKISAGLYLKNAPKDHRGLAGETWTLGNEPVSFGVLMASFVRKALSFYINTIDISTNDVNEEIQMAAKLIANLKVNDGGSQ